MSNTNTTVAVSVNEGNLLKALKQTFTNSDTFLGELMQNSRRANATSVKFSFDDQKNTLTISDDGCGISSFDKLLSIGDSGWDQEVIQQEHPFGIGFLSALYACKNITLISQPGKFSMDTDRILSMEEIVVTPVASYSGTTIVMVGVTFNRRDIFNKLKTLSTGFPIPVELDGHLFERKNALSECYIKTEIGHVSINSMSKNSITDSYSESFIVYLQGLPIYKSNSYSYFDGYFSNIVHLDSAIFQARLPDRDKLIDEAAKVAEIKKILTREVAILFLKLKETHKNDPVYLAGFYDFLKYWGLIHLLNDVKALPFGTVQTFENYPNCRDSYFGSFLSPVSAPVTEIEVLERGVVSIDESIDEEGALCHMFALSKDQLVYREGSLHQNHWIHSHIKRLENPTVELINETHDAPFHEDYVWTNVRFCDEYTITINGETVTVRAHSVYLGEGRGIIAVKKDNTAQVLSQASSFTDGNDNYQEDGFINESAKFFNFIVANRCEKAVDAVRQLLPDRLICPLINNRSFMLSIDENGNLSITDELPPEPVLDKAA